MHNIGIIGIYFFSTYSNKSNCLDYKEIYIYLYVALGSKISISYLKNTGTVHQFKLNSQIQGRYPEWER